MISWGPAKTSLIASGAYDAQIRARALQIRELAGPVLLRWFWEMDGMVNRAEAVSPASFIRAWRHIHNIFTRAGARNVRWVWCPNAFNFRTGVAQQFYPGSAYVDWIGADGYNWSPARPGSPWVSFGQIFSGFYRWPFQQPVGRCSSGSSAYWKEGQAEGCMACPGWPGASNRVSADSRGRLLRLGRPDLQLAGNHLGVGTRGIPGFANDPYFTARAAR